MGLLDDLKQQADSVLLKQRTSDANRVQNLQQSHERMKSALQYWLDFFKALNVLKPPVRRNYYIEGTTQLEGLEQCEYNVNSRRITFEHHDYIDSIELRFRCVSDSRITIEKDSEVLITRLRELLWQHGLKFDSHDIRREGAFVERSVFTILAEVSARLTIAADVEHGQIALTVKNLERLGEYTYVYDYDEFGAELFEEMGKAILAKPNQLRRMGRRQAAISVSSGAPQRRAIDATRANAPEV